MKDKSDINSRLGKVVSEAKDTLKGKDSKEKRSTKKVLSKMSM